VGGEEVKFPRNCVLAQRHLLEEALLAANGMDSRFGRMKGRFGHDPKAHKSWWPR
jgi:hypothetical protein